MQKKATNKTFAIYSTLRKELYAGLYPVGSRFPSEYELALRFEINKLTANKAVTLLVNEGFLQRGHRGAGTLVLNDSLFPRKLIAFVGTITHPYVASILEGAQKAALCDGYAVCTISPIYEELTYYLNKISPSSFKGILAINYGLITASSVPVIHLDCYSPNVSWVNCNNYQGARLMMEALIARGHREIVLISSGMKADNRAKRIRGFHDVMLESGIRDAQKRTFAFLGKTLHEAIQLLKAILSLFPKTTTIATDSDDDAIFMLRAAKEENIKVPEQICITGFGNVKNISDYFNLPSIDQHPARMGAVACESLISKIENNEELIQLELDVETVNFTHIPRV